MIKPLRKYHLVIWQSLAVLLPLFFIMAIMFRPATPSPLEFRDKDFSAAIVKRDSTYVITVDVAGVSNASSCVVVLSHTSGDLILGTVDREGTYTFVEPTIQMPVTLKLWDAIHRQTIDSLQLTQKNSE